jgi:hypothetical protein
MPTYKVPVSWEVYGHDEVEAESAAEALEIARADDRSLPQGDYIEGSFKVDEEIFWDDPEFCNNEKADG